MISFLQFWRPLWNDKGHKTQSAWLGDPSRQETDEETQESPTAWILTCFAFGECMFWRVLKIGSLFEWLFLCVRTALFLPFIGVVLCLAWFCCSLCWGCGVCAFSL
jgi:hypothetical protein